MLKHKEHYSHGMPEYPGVTLGWNGYQGGDAGHGGELILRIDMEAGDMAVQVEDPYETGDEARPNVYNGEATAVSISFLGDMEARGALDALIHLGHLAYKIKQAEDEGFR